MSLYKFQEYIYLEYKKNYFLWEPAWSSFRPIHGIQWNGNAFVVNDREYCTDPLDTLYGYGSPKMKQICDVFTQKYASQISTAKVVDSPETGSLRWFYDRRVSLTPCCTADKAAWKRMVRGRYKTLRSGTAEKFTRRNRISR